MKYVYTVMQRSICDYYLCVREFTHYPTPIPLRVTDDSKFYVTGCFCSFSCAQAHIILSRKPRNYPDLRDFTRPYMQDAHRFHLPPRL